MATIPSIDDLLDVCEHGARVGSAPTALDLATRVHARLKEGGRPDNVLADCDELLETHGVESLTVGERELLYCNAGDTYNVTLAYDESEKAYIVTCWGDWFEGTELATLEEEWENESSWGWPQVMRERLAFASLNHESEFFDAVPNAVLRRTWYSAVEGDSHILESDGSFYFPFSEEINSHTWPNWRRALIKAIHTYRKEAR